MTSSKQMAIYCRVSSSGQSTESQEPDLQRWATAYAADQPVVWYRDISNDHRQMNRPDWNRLEQQIFAGNVSTLVIWKLDRLGRSTIKLCQLFEELTRLGVNLISLKESFDLSSPSGRLLAKVMSSIAEYELEVSSMRIRAGKARRRELGLRQASRQGQRLKVTAEMLATIQEMQAQGFKTGRIAAAVGLSAGHVRRVLRQTCAGKILPRVLLMRQKVRHTKVTANDIRVLKNLLAQDLPRTQIAKTLGWSRQHLYRMIAMYCCEGDLNILKTDSST